MTEYNFDSTSVTGTSATGSPSGVSQSSGITGRQPKGASSNGTASSVASIESPVLKVSPAELSRLSNVLVQSVDVTRYYDSYEFDNASLTEGKYYFGGGYVSFHSGGAVEYSAIVSDYRGSTRVVLSAAGGSLQKSVQQLNGDYPSGALVADYQTSHLGGKSSADIQTRKFTGKELDRMHGLDWHDFGARRYDAAAVFFTSPDPLSEKYYHINPYVYCAGNPVNLIDPDGRNPIYNTDGDFLGTDDKGLRGSYYVINTADFTQGMSNNDAASRVVQYDISEDLKKKIEGHYDNLQNRPDYDGFVTVEEGINWAKSHPNALKNPTPDNTLYLDASKLDFGSLSVSDFPEIDMLTPQNLFSDKNILNSTTNSKLLSTVYALGRVNMILTDKSKKTVMIVNDPATDYDWNVGGGWKRDSFIRTNNMLFGINPNVHGFKTFYYGIGTLRK